MHALYNILSSSWSGWLIPSIVFQIILKATLGFKGLTTWNKKKCTTTADIKDNTLFSILFFQCTHFIMQPAVAHRRQEPLDSALFCIFTPCSPLLQTQVALLTKYLWIGKHCYESRNFATAMQVLGGLENVIVRQLPVRLRTVESLLTRLPSLCNKS